MRAISVRLCYSLFLFVILAGVLPKATLEYAERKEIVCFSIIIEKAQYFDELAAWLDDLNYSDFTFAIRSVAIDYILDNSTRIDRLTKYGSIIPEIDYVQLNTTAVRKRIIDQCLEKWSQRVGYLPKGIMSFQPDTYTSRYLLERGLLYIQGLTFDAYSVDYMTQRGGFQMPYYAHPSHILRPYGERGIVVLPHSTWDWLESFRTTQNMHLHPMNLIKEVFHNNASMAKEYFFALIDESISSSRPFGLAICQFEWAWCYEWDCSNEALEWIRAAVTTRSYDFWDFETVAEWFLSSFRCTPAYYVNFTSPYSKGRIEWYYDVTTRVARLGDQVVSYIDYALQAEDRYLTQTGHINWYHPKEPSNCIDDSLVFGIDALGGAKDRAPVRTYPSTFYGNLAEFRYGR